MSFTNSHTLSKMKTVRADYLVKVAEETAKTTDEWCTIELLRCCDPELRQKQVDHLAVGCAQTEWCYDHELSAAGTWIWREV